jgi:hypothetical protein
MDDDFDKPADDRQQFDDQRRDDDETEIIMAKRKAKATFEKAKAAQHEFEVALAYCNELLIARGESPIGMDNILFGPVALKRMKRDPSSISQTKGAKQ